MTFAAHDQVAVRHAPELPGGIIRNSGLRETDVVATPPQFTHATRRLSCGRVDSVEAPRHRDDAIAANQTSWDTKSSETDAEIRTRMGLCGWNAAALTALT